MAHETAFAQNTHDVPSASRREKLFLPVCCRCRLIRDESSLAVNGARWVTRQTFRKTYGVNPADCLLTHTYCPGCFTRVMERMKAAAIIEGLGGVNQITGMGAALSGQSRAKSARSERKQEIAVA